MSFLDLSKAFDTVNFNGVRGTPLLWIQDYLFDRYQHASFSGTCSPKCPILMGVTQGSILDPLLFLDDLIDIPAKFKAILNAPLAIKIFS